MLTLEWQLLEKSTMSKQENQFTEFTSSEKY